MLFATSRANNLALCGALRVCGGTRRQITFQSARSMFATLALAAAANLFIIRFFDRQPINPSRENLLA